MIMRSNGKLFSIVMIALLLVGCTAPAAVSPTVTTAPTSTTVPSPMPTVDPVPAGHLVYASQSGDTLAAVANHFDVKEEQIIFAEGDELSGLLSPETILYIPDVLEDTTPDVLLIPDSDLVYSPSTIGFDVNAFVEEQGGRLAEYTELMTRGTTPGAEILTQLAVEFSVNPRILLTLMEYASGWVNGQPQTDAQGRYPYGFMQTDKGGLYKQLGLAVRELERGYYGWRAGTLTEVTFSDGSSMRLAPNLNAGTVAVLTYLAAISTPQDWESGLSGENSIPAVHAALFGDAWQRAGKVEPLFEAGVAQPELHLPFPVGEFWNYTCAPHSAWGKNTPEAALDFAPPLDRAGCGTSIKFATAAASGLVVRTGTGVAVLDLDGDGNEQTGWVLLYLHVSSTEKVQVGDWVEVDENIGHPSCVGGSSSGIHIHIARKYNGEWVLAEGGLPFVLSGYQAYKDEKFCEGTLVKDDIVIEAYPWGNYKTQITRPETVIEEEGAQDE